MDARRLQEVNWCVNEGKLKEWCEHRLSCLQGVLLGSTKNEYSRMIAVRRSKFSVARLDLQYFSKKAHFCRCDEPVPGSKYVGTHGV